MISENKIFIKGMVCNRCIAVITAELINLGLNVSEIFLGEVTFKSPINEETKQQIAQLLKNNGFQLLEDKNRQLVEQVKFIVKHGIELQMQTRSPLKFSELITSHLHKDYNTLSTLFSAYEGVTLEKHIISERICIVKNYLVTTSKSLTEISDELGYSSVSHLSRQLKSYTGHDVNYFKRMRLAVGLN